MQLYFIRHGQSENNLLYTQTGDRVGRLVDPALTAVGEEQAQYVADFLSDQGRDGKIDKYDLQNVHGFGLTHVYTSLMVRSVATGAKIARASQLPLIGWQDLHETGGMFMEVPETGELLGQPGKNRAYFEAHYPELVLPESVTEAGWWNRAFESPQDRQPRAQRVLADLLGRHGTTEDHVAMVSHGGFFNHFLAAFLDVPSDDCLWFYMNNTAITRIDFDAEKKAVVYLNRVNFLPDALIT